MEWLYACNNEAGDPNWKFLNLYEYTDGEGNLVIEYYKEKKEWVNEQFGTSYPYFVSFFRDFYKSSSQTTNYVKNLKKMMDFSRQLFPVGHYMNEKFHETYRNPATKFAYKYYAGRINDLFKRLGETQEVIPVDGARASNHLVEDGHLMAFSEETMQSLDAITSTFIELFFDQNQGDKDFSEWMRESNAAIFIDKRYRVDPEYEYQSLNQFLGLLKDDFILTPKITVPVTVMEVDVNGQSHAVTYKIMCDSQFEADTIETLKPLFLHLGKVFAGETFKKMLWTTSGTSLGRHSLDICLQFQDLLGVMFECLGFGEHSLWYDKNGNPIEYGNPKGEILLEYLAHGFAAIYTPYTENGVAEFYDNNPTNPIGKLAPYLHADQLGVFVNALVKGFELGLSFQEVIWYMGSDKTVNVDGVYLPMHEALGFNEQKDGQDFMELFGLKKQNHQTDPVMFAPDGSPVNNVFITDPTIDGKFGVDMTQWWWNFLHAQDTHLPSVSPPELGPANIFNIMLSQTSR
ncbi:MAG: hypothetical protein ACTSRK_07330 [Promethearchaeota archaeon]